MGHSEAGPLPRTAERFAQELRTLLHENAKSLDKDYAMIEGAVHGGQPCVPCESFPGQFSSSVKNRYDYMEQWIRARF